MLAPTFKKDVKVLECTQKTPRLSSLEKRRLRQDLIVLCSFLRRWGGSFPACSLLVPPHHAYPTDFARWTRASPLASLLWVLFLAGDPVSVSIPDHAPVCRGPFCVRSINFSISSILSLILIALSSLKPLDDPDLTFPLGVLPCPCCLPTRICNFPALGPLWCFSASFRAITLRAHFFGPAGRCILQEF